MAQPLKLEDFVWATGVFCQLNRIPHDAALLIKQYPPPYDVVNLQQALQRFGLNNSLKQYSIAQLPNASLPCLAILNPAPQTTVESAPTIESDSESNPASTADEQASVQQSTPTYGIALILSRDEQRLLVLQPNQAEPVTVSVEDFTKQITGDFLMVRKAEEMVADDGNTISATQSVSTATQKEFGFKWFVPELLKYKKIWSEVLLASLTIQLVGLAVPICTQIVIDKVVVHHTTSTLIVIASALFIFLIFTAAMGWVRQYLVLHTGNRIDATLGHKVFSHLLDLPVRYYDHRPTGVIIARVHGVETIREFLAGGLVTLLLDLPFLIVFLAIMFWYSWQLSLIAVTCLTLITILSALVTPIIRAKLNHQFMLGARN